MKFRTETDFIPAQLPIEIDSRIFSIGSCFAGEIHELLSRGQLQTLHNPFGTLFHPLAIHTAVRRLHDARDYSDEDFIFYNERYISPDHHSSFDNRYLHKSLEKINHSLQQGNAFLQQASHIIITYGTAWVYDFLPKQVTVANCHKIPGRFFKKRLLTDTEITTALRETIELLTDMAPQGLQIYFTLSPVRHTRDGLVENQLSKAKLLCAMHEVIADYPHCSYLPVYETLIDDLRDYRFYREDLVHPTEQAVRYVWEKFSATHLTDNCLRFVSENFKIASALEHKPSDNEDPDYLEFRAKLKERIQEQQAKVRHKIFKQND